MLNSTTYKCIHIYMFHSKGQAYQWFMSHTLKIMADEVVRTHLMY